MFPEYSVWIHRTIQRKGIVCLRDISVRVCLVLGMPYLRYVVSVVFVQETRNQYFMKCREYSGNRTGLSQMRI